MEFNHDTWSSKLFVYYVSSILVMRFVYTGFFAYALWRMYQSLKNDPNARKKVNYLAFYIHLAAMIVQTLARAAETISFIKAAWQGDLPKTLFFWSNVFVVFCSSLCYSLIFIFCWKMFKDYRLMITNEEKTI